MSELADIATRVASWAADGEEIEAFVARARETEIRAYGGEVESLTSAESSGIGVRVVTGGRQGFAYAGTLDEAALAETLTEARDNAQFAGFDEFNGVAHPDGVAPADLNFFHEELASFRTDDKVALAIELERATLAADPRIGSVESAEYVDSIFESAVATSTGIASTSRETGCYLAAYALANDKDETQTGFGFSIGREPEALDVTAASADAAMRATRMLGATKPPTARLTVVLDPWVTASLLGIVGHTLTGEAVQKGRSLFAGRLDEQVAATSLTLVDNATDPEAFTACNLDGEGLATRPTRLITEGVLDGFLHNSYSGRRDGTASTGSAIRGGFKSAPGVGALALTVTPGDRTPEELIAGIDDGLLVQGVTGLHSGVNPVSGDFSTGAEGLRIRAGETAEPVREVTIASTLQRLLHDIAAVGCDLQRLPTNAVGVTLVVSDVTMSGD